MHSLHNLYDMWRKLAVVVAVIVAVVVIGSSNIYLSVYVCEGRGWDPRDSGF